MGVVTTDGPTTTNLSPNARAKQPQSVVTLSGEGSLGKGTLESSGSNSWLHAAHTVTTATSTTAQSGGVTHYFDVYPENKGPELRIREEGKKTSVYLSGLSISGARTYHSGDRQTDLQIATFSTLTALHKQYGYYNPEVRDGTSAQQRELSRLVDVELDKARTQKEQDDILSKIKMLKFAISDPDDKERNELACKEEAGLVYLGLKEFGKAAPRQARFELWAGEAYDSLSAISAKPQLRHSFVYAPPETGSKDLGYIIEATSKDPNSALKEIVRKETVHGREFLVTKGELYYRMIHAETEIVR